jgi:segregation and condensation protein B
MEEKTSETRPTDHAEDIESAPEETVAAEPDAEERPADQETEEPSEEEAPEQLSDEELRNVLEVLLLVSDRPLPISKIREVIEGVETKRIRETIVVIEERLRENGFPYQVREVGGGYVLSTKGEYASWIRKLYSPKAKTTKLSQAALETLAVVAYKQPVTRAEIEAIRGVNVDSTLKTLLEKRLAEIVGYKDVIGKPATYGTTSEFLLHFGLNTLTDLPSIEELRSSDSKS